MLILAALIFGAAVKGQTPDPRVTTINLWLQDTLGLKAKGQRLVEHDITRPGDAKIGEKTVVRLTNITNPTITVYRPKKANGSAIIVCPGGGYGILAMDLEGTEICAWLNSIGMTAILLKYRVPALPGMSRYEYPLQDAQRALGLVRFNASKWQINPQHIGMLGFSAGGHLTAALCNNYKARTYLSIDAADAVSCRPDFAILIYPAYLKDDHRKDSLSKEVQVTSDTPPTFIVQTEDDPIDVRNALLYYSELEKYKVPAEMRLFATGGHGYGIRSLTNGIAEYPGLIEKWLFLISFNAKRIRKSP